MIGATTAADSGVYQSLLGAGFAALHPKVRAGLVPPFAASGTMDVVHGSHRVVRPFVWMLNLPAAGLAQAATLHVTETVDTHGWRAMVWNRVFGDSQLRTTQTARRGRLVDRRGGGAVEFVLREAGGSLVFEQRSMRVLGVPLWSAWAPRIAARASPASSGWVVDVTVDWRRHLICRYTGTMCLAGAPA